MRKAWASRGHNAIDDCGPVDLERCVDLGVQLAGLRRPESMTAACPHQSREIGIGEFDSLLIQRQTDRLRFQRDEPERRIFVDHDLHRFVCTAVKNSLSSARVMAMRWVAAA
jgi:hypothetical protein